jgi:hypothetical protein
VTITAKKVTCLGGATALAVALILGSGALAAPANLDELPRLANGAIDFSGSEWAAVNPGVGDVLTTDRFVRNDVHYRLDIRAPWDNGSLGWGANPLFANVITNEDHGDSHTYSYSNGNGVTSSFVITTASGLRGFRCSTGRFYYTGTLQGSPVAAKECEDRQTTDTYLKASDVLRATADGRVVHDVTLTNAGTEPLADFSFGAWLDTMLDSDDEIPLIKSTRNAIYMENAEFRLYLAMTGGDAMIAGGWTWTPSDFAYMADVSDFNAGDVVLDNIDSTVAFMAIGRTLAPGQSLTMSFEERVFSVSELQPGRADVTLVNDDRSGAPVTPANPDAAQLTGEPLTEIGFTMAKAQALAPAGYEVASIDNVTLYDDNNSTVQQIVVHLVHAHTTGTVTQTRTITYQGAGASTPAEVVQTQDFEVDTDQITGVTTYRNGNGLAAVPNPEITGYRALDPDVPAVAPNAPATTTLPQDIDVLVRYTRDVLQAVITLEDGVEGGQVTVSGADSFEPRGDELSFAWDLDNDGAYDDSDQAEATLTLPVAGTYPVSLRVTDEQGRTDTATANVRATNVVPVVNIGSDAQTGTDGAFARNGSFADPGADAWTAEVSYGDGTSTQDLQLQGKNFALDHSYAEPGQYLVTVRVSDLAGASTGAAQIMLTVPSVPIPTPTPTPTLAPPPPPTPTPTGSTAVPPSPASPSSQGPVPEELPFSGVDLTIPALGSLLLILSGLAAMASRRRRLRSFKLR